MKRFVLLLLAMAAPGVASASDFCDDLWFTRNLVMDRAGYCFGSALGQAVFDNSNCTGKDVSLSPRDQAVVREVQRIEKQQGCSVDTSRRSLALDDIAFRRRLVDLPIIDELGLGSGCLGWRGGRQPLYAGHSADTQVLGWIEPGQYVGYFYGSEDSPDDWFYVVVKTVNWERFVAAGWARTTSDEECDGWAG